VFSTGKDQPDFWMTDFYDDAILEFDQTFKQIITFLKREKKYDNTVVILYSDHGIHHRTDTRIPLLIWFPGRPHRGHVAESAQNIDIAPTVLDYLDIPQPRWMTGQSLIADKLDQCRWIISTKARTSKMRIDGRVQIVNPGPPFFALATVGVNVC